MNTMTEKMSLKQARAQVGVSQTELGLDARVDQTRISKMEHNLPISEDTALKLWYSLNRFRTARGMVELAFDDITWVLTRQGQK